MPKRSVAAVALGLVALLAAACVTDAPPPPAAVASGAPREAVLADVGVEPVSEERFTIADHPGLAYDILQYRFRDPTTGEAVDEWLMFGRDGFVGRGRGSIRIAKARAYDLYYSVLADHGTMSRAAAERAFAARLDEIFDGDLNPAAAVYMEERHAALAAVRTSGLTEDEADARIHAALLQAAGRRVTDRPDDGRALERWDALEAIGLEYRRRSRPAADGHPGADCLSMRVPGAATAGTRCR